MLAACLSDTHMRHDRVRVPPCDLLLHAGDFTRRGTRDEAVAFLRWLGAQPARHKVLVAGNHDDCFERDGAWARDACRREGVTYLENELVEIEGLRVWGSPMTPIFRHMAFNRPDEALASVWGQIPDNLDVLITHGPPRGVCDRMFLGARVGCPLLRDRVREARPKVHLFGHIHEASGEHHEAGVRYHNVAVARWLSREPRPPVMLTL